MISLQNVSKWYTSRQGRQTVFDKVNFEIPYGHNIAILGKNGSGKSTLFRMLAGSEYPNRGVISTSCSISWPVALATGIHPAMSGRENARFIARVNGVVDLAAYESKVIEFSELGKRFDLPVKSYSSGMRSRLAFSCCIGIGFDLYLIDEALSVGDQVFKRKARQALIDKSVEASILMVSHDMEEVQEFCDSAILIEDGSLRFINDIDAAISAYCEGGK